MKLVYTVFVMAFLLDSMGAHAVEPVPVQVKFEIYNGYFASNKFEPASAESFLVLKDRATFDAAFGAGYVMNDTSHRLPPKVFDASWVIATVKRGTAVYTYEVKDVGLQSGVLTVHYTTNAKESPSAKFASPLIISVPAGEYSAVVFDEDGAVAKKLDLVKQQAPVDSKRELPATAPAVPTIFAIECQKPADSIDVSVAAGKTVLTVNSSTGIGEATVTRNAEHWPDPLILRLKLTGLEALSLGAGGTELCASVLSHSGNRTLLHQLVQGREGPAVIKGDPLWIEIRAFDDKGATVGGLPPAGGGFELTIPKALLTDADKSIAIGWINFYRR